MDKEFLDAQEKTDQAKMELHFLERQKNIITIAGELAFVGDDAKRFQANPIIQKRIEALKTEQIAIHNDNLSQLLHAKRLRVETDIMANFENIKNKRKNIEEKTKNAKDEDRLFYENLLKDIDMVFSLRNNIFKLLEDIEHILSKEPIAMPFLYSDIEKAWNNCYNEKILPIIPISFQGPLVSCGFSCQELQSQYRNYKFNGF